MRVRERGSEEEDGKEGGREIVMRRRGKGSEEEGGWRGR